MGKVLSSGGGGGTIFSSDLTSIAGHVLKGDSYVGNDTNDDQGVGTMPDIVAVDEGVSVAQSDGKLFCRMHNGAHIKDAESGYPEVSYDLATVRKAINYTDTSKVLTGTNIAGASGTMKNLSDSPNTKRTGSDATPVLIGDAGFWDTNADGKARISIRYNGTQGFIKPNTLVGVEKATLKSAVVSAYGIGSITSFNISQYNTKTILCSWAKPGNGKMWSGVVVRAKQGGYPSSVSDGTEITGGTNGTSVTKALGAGTWYFKFWNYVTVSSADGSRWYDGGTNGGAFNNQEVRGERTFTSSQNFTIPTGVRSITAFLVGGGGGTPGMSTSSDSSQVSGGGGGGYTTTTSFNVEPGQVLNINVGGGGGWGGNGGESSIYRSGSKLASAGGGNAAKQTRGGDGGSGGGGPRGSKSKSVSGGSDGSDGCGNTANAARWDVGCGQHRSTKCWDGTLYAGGGGGGSTSTLYTGSGGAGGGGYGGGRYTDKPSSGKSNTGGGGGGGGHDSNEGSADGACGGSGIVRIKWGY